MLEINQYNYRYNLDVTIDLARKSTRFGLRTSDLTVIIGIVLIKVKLLKSYQDTIYLRKRENFEERVCQSKQVRTIFKRLCLKRVVLYFISVSILASST